MGSEQVGVLVHFFVQQGDINSLCENSGTDEQIDWLVDQSAQLRPGMLEGLDELAAKLTNQFRRKLYDALILYSRQCLAQEFSDRLVFTFAALESMLLRNENEPIQKNLAERIAFLIGTSIGVRKEIIKNVGLVYGSRSAFVHHGQKLRHVESSRPLS